VDRGNGRSPLDMASDLNSDRHISGLPFDPLRLLGVDPSISDSGTDSTYARKEQATSQQGRSLDDQRSDPAPASRTCLPLDGRSDHLDSFYSDALSTIDEVVEAGLRFPAVTRTNLLVRSAVRLGVSDKLMLALVDGHTAIDAVGKSISAEVTLPFWPPGSAPDGCQEGTG
jgi:hypothetical protein